MKLDDITVVPFPDSREVKKKSIDDKKLFRGEEFFFPPLRMDKEKIDECPVTVIEN